LTDPIIGVFTAKLEDILQMTISKGADAWYPLSDCMSGKVRVSAVWKPLDMAGNMQGAGSYQPPIGVVRLWYVILPPDPTGADALRSGLRRLMTSSALTP
jgi:Ca2+-dependent lipid-binding protein